MRPRSLRLAREPPAVGHHSAHGPAPAASVDLDGKLIAGSLPRRAVALVADWARQHRGELEANWERARCEEPLEPIGPLP
ncbi:MAG: DUF4160 domain-containing protein [bacterium]